MEKRRNTPYKVLALMLAQWLLFMLLPPLAVMAAGEASVGLIYDGKSVSAGKEFTIGAGFDLMAETNAIILQYSFNGDLFEYIGYLPAEGLSVANERCEAGVVRLTLMAPAWQARDLGVLALKAKEDVDFEREAYEISLDVEYVVRDKAGDKSIQAAGGAVEVPIRGNNGPLLEGDTNNDHRVDLIDLSNMVDWFGYDETADGWDDWTVYFDFNANGQIDVHDIAHVARRIGTSGRAALTGLIARAQALDEGGYTPGSWAALWDALSAAKAVAANENTAAEEIARAIGALKDAMDALVEKSADMALVAFVVEPAQAAVEVRDAENALMVPTAGNRLAYELAPGGYTYTVSADGCQSETAAFEALAAAVIEVSLAGMAPSLTEVRFKDAGTLYVRENTGVMLYFTASEKLAEFPQVKLAGKTVNVNYQDAARNIYRAYLYVDASTPEGEMSIEINYQNLAGAEGVTATRTTDGSAVIVRKSAP